MPDTGSPADMNAYLRRWTHDDSLAKWSEEELREVEEACRDVLSNTLKRRMWPSGEALPSRRMCNVVVY
jgi:hypothetical protein